LLIGDKWHRIELDGGEQLGRHLSLLDSGATEEEEEEEEEAEDCTAIDYVNCCHCCYEAVIL